MWFERICIAVFLLCKFNSFISFVLTNLNLIESDVPDLMWWYESPQQIWIETLNSTSQG